MNKNHKELEQLWNQSGPKDITFLMKVFNAFKKMALIAIGLAVGLFLMLFKRSKDHQLKMKEQQELLATQQRKAEMEALWASQQHKLRNPNLQVSDQITKQVILEELDESS